MSRSSILTKGLHQQAVFERSPAKVGDQIDRNNGWFVEIHRVSMLLITSKAFNMRNIKATTIRVFWGRRAASSGSRSLRCLRALSAICLEPGTELDLFGSEADSQSDGRFRGGPSGLGGLMADPSIAIFHGD